MALAASVVSWHSSNISISQNRLPFVFEHKKILHFSTSLRIKKRNARKPTVTFCLNDFTNLWDSKFNWNMQMNQENTTFIAHFYIVVLASQFNLFPSFHCKVFVWSRLWWENLANHTSDTLNWMQSKHDYCAKLTF